MQNVYDLIAMWQYIVEFSCFVINVITLERKLVLAALYVFFCCISFFKGKANVTDYWVRIVPMVRLPFKWNLFSSTVTRYCYLVCSSNFRVWTTEFVQHNWNPVGFAFLQNVFATFLRRYKLKFGIFLVNFHFGYYN